MKLTLKNMYCLSNIKSIRLLLNSAASSLSEYLIYETKNSKLSLVFLIVLYFIVYTPFFYNAYYYVMVS